VAEEPTIERFDAAAHNPFDALGFRCFVERRNNQVLHRIARSDERGNDVGEVAVEVQYALGSGRGGRSYLVEHDGFLVESPVSWYSQPSRWDLSPGYAEQSPHFDRPVTAKCLFCHSNGVDALPDTINRYKQPIFQGYGIGCERCHGPGERHVQAARQDRSTEDTIVNPAQLEPALREAVCHQCHLQGALRVPRLARGVFDYRPGLPLFRFWSIFEPTPDRAGLQKAVGHVEQLQASRCFNASGGRMGCISCHDAHRLPAGAERDSYYQRRCLACHIEKDGGGPAKDEKDEQLAANAQLFFRTPTICSAPLAERRRTRPENSCIQCHMGRFQSADIAHMAATDHRIMRRGGGEAPAPAVPSRQRPMFNGMGGFVHFHDDALAPEERALVEWDLVADQSGRLSPGMLERHAGGSAAVARGQALLPRIEEALVELPGNLVLMEAKGCALWMQNRTEEAAAAFDAVLARAPQRESALDLAGSLANRTKRWAAAANYWDRAAKASPWRWRYQQQLAENYARQSAWALALEPCEKAVALNPGNLETRRLLVGCWLGLGDKAKADAEFAILLQMQPPNADKLREWYAKRSATKP
jgi:tetratricopeptide (TPR) repeat protein